MKKISTFTIVLLFIVSYTIAAERTQKAQNPIIYADVPDMSMIRVGDTYYMSSTTMHMSPGVPIMKSKDLVNWELVNYAYDILDDVDAMNMNNGKSTYGQGTWASSIRYHKGIYYVSTFSKTTDKTYIYSTKEIEKGPWKKVSFSPAYHDSSLFFDDDGRIYYIYGNGTINIVELNSELTGIISGTDRVLIENASLPAGENVFLGAEGSHMLKHEGKYYLFNISMSRQYGRCQLVHRADKVRGPYEGKLILSDRGVAQGSLIETPDGKWFAYLFRDNGAVGRIPYYAPAKWENGWPVLGVDGKIPDTFDLPASKGLIPGIVNSDEFTRKKGERPIPLVWQWNHNPDNKLWSLTDRTGYLRLKTGRTDKHLVDAKNMLTQRIIGPVCSGTTKIDLSQLKDGDNAGLCVLQRQYGQVGVKIENGKKYISMISNEKDSLVELHSIPFNQNIVYFKIDCDFRDRVDIAKFYYSLDGGNWQPVGQLKMRFTLMEHFVGYRYGLYNYSTKTPGGYADFDYFRISEKIEN